MRSLLVFLNVCRRFFFSPTYLFGSSVLAFPASAAGAEPLRLVAEYDGARYEHFSLADRTVTVADSTRSPLPRGVRWKVEGDLRAHQSDLYFSPPYNLRRGAAQDWYQPERDGYVAIVHLQFTTEFTRKQIGDALAVVLWMLDGTLVKTVVSPTASVLTREGNYAALIPIALTAQERRGAPVLLIWKDGQFVQPPQWFSDPMLNAALADMYLGTPADFESALGVVKSVARRSRNDTTLLHFAAEGGFVSALGALRKRKASVRGGNIVEGTALHVAAELGRIETVEWLWREDPHRLRRENDDTAFDCALSAGHLEVAELLAGAKWSDESRKVFVAAVENRDVTIARRLAQQPGAKLTKGTAAELMAVAIGKGDVNLVEVLLGIGASADGHYKRTPHLVYAADWADLNCVETLLRGGANPNSTGKDGRTALMVAAQRGAQDVVDALLKAGAKSSGLEIKIAPHRFVRNRAEANGPVYDSFTVDLPPTIKKAVPLEGDPGVTNLKFHAVNRVQPVAAWGQSGGLEMQQAVFTSYDVVSGERSVPLSWAVLSIVVETDGRVMDAEVIGASGDYFGKVALERVREFEFFPGVKGGSAVRARTVIGLLPGTRN